LKSDWAFDQKGYEELNRPREAVVRELIAQVKVALPLATAVDVGCGVGYFSNVLHSLGLNVLGLDAREQNVLEARHRYPHIRFEVMNAEDSRALQFGQFDLVFCFGLLYHLENPFQVIRNLSAMTGQFALLEGVCYPSKESVMVLVEEDELDDQGVNNIAFCPSEACLLQMLYRSGYKSCFLPRIMPAHPYYNPGEDSFRLRTLIAASKRQLEIPSLVTSPVPTSELRAWHFLPMRAIGKRAYRLLEFFENIRRSKVQRNETRI